MDSKIFLDNFNHFLDIPNGIQKLRDLILDLAVHGKLVPQYPNDEPASVLLEKIKSEKKRLIKEKKIKKSKLLPPIEKNEIPYDLPSNWEWMRLGNTGSIFNGNSINARDKQILYSNVKAGLPYIGTKDVGYGREVLNYANGISIPLNEAKFKVAHRNTILICSEGGSAGKKIGLTDRDICFGNKLYANEVFEVGIYYSFVFYYYQSSIFFKLFKERMTGIIGGVSINKFMQIEFPLPPLAEQKRIVTKIDELMLLCDKLEEQQQEKIKLNSKINIATLDKLQNSSNDDDFSANWQNLKDNFSMLYMVGGSIQQGVSKNNFIPLAKHNLDKLRQNILQLAIQGKLTTSWRIAHPHVLSLDCIKTISSENLLPRSWQHVELIECLDFGPKNGFSPKPVSYETPIRSLTLSATSSGYFDSGASKFVDVEIAEDSYLWLQTDDILIQRGNSLDYVGIAAIFNSEPNKFIYPDLMIKLKTKNFFIPQYAVYMLNSPQGRKYMQSNASGTSGSMPKISGKIVKKFPVNLPPLAEQKQIVTKIDQLMKLCNELEKKLINKQEKSTRLLNSILNQLNI